MITHMSAFAFLRKLGQSLSEKQVKEGMSSISRETSQSPSTHTTVSTPLRVYPRLTEL